MTVTMALSEIPQVDADQMREVDRAMVEDYRIWLIQMMENAGRCLAHLARAAFLEGDPRGKRVVVLAGSGGNGGGALVAARRLANWGAIVTVGLARPPQNMAAVPWHQLEILRRMTIKGASETLVPRDLPSAPDLIVDGLIGYSLKGAPYGRAAELINWANESTHPILALDTPSGVDASTGTIFQPAITARATLTLALPKKGLVAQGLSDNVGELYLADIGVPPALYGRAPLNLTTKPIFALDDIIHLTR